MQQSLLPLALPHQPTLADVVVGQNSALHTALQQWLGHGAALDAAGDADNPYRFVYAWGASGAGKTLLAQSLHFAAKTAYLSPQLAPSVFEHIINAAPAAVIVDDIDALDATQQSLAFALYNRVRAQAGGKWLAFGQAPLNALRAHYRDDLRSRLAWGLVFELHALSDDDKIQALAQHASQLGFVLSLDEAQQMLLKLPRNMAALRSALDDLNRYCLVQQKAATAHTVARWLNDYITQPLL